MGRESILEFGGKARRRGPVGRPRHIWYDNNKMYLRKGAVVWTGLIGTSGRLL
jgi:hypothetical protein